jgi:basic membrane protein A and related proteins
VKRTSTARNRTIGGRVAAALVVACSASTAAGMAAASAPPDTGGGDTGGSDTSAGAAAVDLDANGDGVVVFGVATPGPRDDGAYYQAAVDGVIELSEANGFGEPIIVDNIAAADAETELRNLARQDVDVIVVGAGELSDPLPALTEEFPDIFWYCNCGAGTPDIPGLAQTGDDSSQISYTAGYATGLLLQDTDSTSVAFLGCCDLDFEKEAFLAFEAGLHGVDESFEAIYIPTGDFNDVAGATEAYNQAVADGVGAVYPFLGGSHEAIVGLANEDGIITMSAGASDACEREDLDYDIAVQFDAGDYLAAALTAILDGSLTEGQRLVLEVGTFDKVGAKFCHATDEQKAALQAVRDQIANGDFDELFGEIKAEAYGG